MVVALLGELTVLSGKVDFSLAERPPLGGFQYARHPESFRATLVQVGNDGWQAFATAHRNMDTLQMNMERIPPKVDIIRRTLASNNTKLSLAFINRKIDAALASITALSKKSVELAQATEKMFNGVLLLMGETSASTASVQGLNENKTLFANAEIEYAKQALANLNKTEENYRIEQQEVREEVSRVEPVEVSGEISDSPAFFSLCLHIDFLAFLL